MTDLKRQFEQALREAEGGEYVHGEFPEEVVERRVMEHVRELRFRINVTVIIAGAAFLLAAYSFWRICH